MQTFESRTSLLFKVIVITFLANACLTSFAQDKLANNDLANRFSNSTFDLTAESLGSLIQLTINEGQIGILPNWDLNRDRRNVDLDPKKALDDLIKKYVDERGLPQQVAEQMAKRDLARDGFAGQNEFASSFLKVGKAAGCNSRGGGGGGDSWRWRFSSDTMLGATNGSSNRRSIDLQCLDKEVRVEIAEKPGKSLRIRFSSENELVDLSQNDVRLKVSVIGEKDAETYFASNYFEFVAKHPELTKRTLVPLFNSVGIQEPLSLQKPEVVDAAIEVLRANEQDEMKVIGLLEALTADSLDGRNKAYKELMQGHYKWRSLIERRKDELELDENSRPKLEKILSAAPGTPVQDYVNMLDPAENIPELVRLLEYAKDKDKAIVSRRLEKLTGQTLGGNIAAWKEFLEQSK